MTRVFLATATLTALLVTTGCAQQQPPTVEEPQTAEPQQEEVATQFAYEFEPVSTLEQVVGWPATASTSFCFVSMPIDETCHHTEGTSLIGPAIAESISLDSMAGLMGFTCGITATAGTDRDDVVDEVAWRVDEGLGDLVAAYASTVFPDDPIDCDAVEVPLTAPGLWVQSAGDWFVVRPAAVACAEVISQIEQGTAALRLTEVLRHTTTFEEYEELGF